MGRDLFYGHNAREKILSGVSKLAKTVGVTMGPKGGNVIVSHFIGVPTITKDGVSVAREIVLSDPVEEMGCQLVKEVAGRTADVAGDGTTTATVLAHEIFKNGMELMKDGFNPLEFRAGIEWALEEVLKELNEASQPVNDFKTLENIAIISANNDRSLGGAIAKAFELVGPEGLVTAEAFPGVPNSVREVDGIELKSGYVHSLFLDKGQTKCVFENCAIMLYDGELSTIMDNKELFESLAQKHIPLLVLSKSINKEALKFFLVNQTRGRMRVCAAKLPIFGMKNDEWLEDLAMLVGANIISEENGVSLNDATLKDFGFASRVEVDRQSTKITSSRRDEVRIEDRMNTYTEDLEKLVGDLIRQDIKRRMSFLSSKAAIITVGYSTEAELREKGDRTDDSISAVKAAMEEGYVPGGGFALWRAAHAVSGRISDLDKKYHGGAKVLINSISRPARQILANAGLDPTKILKQVSTKSSPAYGYNTATGEFGNLVDMGVIDPKKVARTALQNATSIALLLITTEAVIAEEPEPAATGWAPPAGWRPASDKGLNHKY